MFRLSFKAAAAALVAVALAACSDAPTRPDATPPSAPDVSAAGPDRVVPGEVIVKMKRGASLSAVRGYGVSLKVQRIGDGAGGEGVAVVQVATGGERRAAARLAADPSVEYAEPNYLRQPTAVHERLWAFYNPGGRNMTYTDPNDPRYRQSLPSSFASKRDADIDNIEGYAAGGANVVIGSIDTGVDFTHPEFAGRLIAGRDWIDRDNDPSDVNDGHGTHTTGTMAGSKVGVAGVSGAAPHVKVHVQRVCDDYGCPTSAIINAINAAADYRDANGNRLVAINLSLSGYSVSQGEKDAIARATARGILVIAAAGNDGIPQVACPACDANAISVGATTWKDSLATYSQYGSGLDVVAPGGTCYADTSEEGCIFSAVPKGYRWSRTYGGPLAGGAYAYMEGTSMATPMVTGTAAIVASRTGLRGSALRSRILSTTNDRGSSGYDTRYGNGRLNAYRAVTGRWLP